MKKTLIIGVGKDAGGWCSRFLQACEEKLKEGCNIQYKLIDIDRHDWLEQLLPLDVFIWRPSGMGVKAASYVREKIYFMEHYLGKLVVPNFNTIWHYESKIAQSYLFTEYGVPTPETKATFCYEDGKAMLAEEQYPIVIKGSAGASSNNVRMAKSKAEAQAELECAFSSKLWADLKRQHPNRFLRTIMGGRRRWFRHHLLKPSEDRGHGVLYWQRFIPGNDADLRITVIGHDKAYAFWRLNRPGDFRASGSGRLEFKRTIPENIVLYCMELNKRFDFDSMAYDILFSEGTFLINEMSYRYIDSALYRAGGYYVRTTATELKYVPKATWPQELWVDWALSRAQAKGIIA